MRGRSAQRWATARITCSWRSGTAPPGPRADRSRRSTRALSRRVVSRMTRSTLFLTVGLPCTGKTTAARRIEIEQKALRLTKDEWVKALYEHENPPSAQDVIEGRLIEIGLRALELGV